MRKFLITPIFFVLIFLASTANAKIYFGTQDSIEFLADTKIQGPTGNHLFLGHRVTTKAFLLPYYVTSNGYVLGFSDEKNKYMPLPSGATLEALQGRGLLPNPLPALEISWFNYLFGYSFWFLLLWMIAPYLKKKFFSKKSQPIHPTLTNTK